MEEKHNTPNSLVYDTGTAKITQILKCTTCKLLECIEEENKKVKQWGEAFTKIKPVTILSRMEGSYDLRRSKQKEYKEEYRKNF